MLATPARALDVWNAHKGVGDAHKSVGDVCLRPVHMGLWAVDMGSNAAADMGSSAAVNINDVAADTSARGVDMSVVHNTKDYKNGTHCLSA